VATLAWILRSATTHATPPSVTAMPSQFHPVSSSPSTTQPSRAVSGGDSEKISVPSRGPIRTHARNRHRSQKKNPARPDRLIHSHVSADASLGTGRPRTSQPYIASSPHAITRRIRLTAIEPTRRPAASKLRALIVQQKAVPNAANSPR